LLRLKKDQEFLKQDFPKRLEKIDLDKLELGYREMLEDDQVMKELEKILTYAMQNMKLTLNE